MRLQWGLVNMSLKRKFLICSTFYPWTAEGAEDGHRDHLKSATRALTRYRTHSRCHFSSPDRSRLCQSDAHHKTMAIDQGLKRKRGDSIFNTSHPKRAQIESNNSDASSNDAPYSNIGVYLPDEALSGNGEDFHVNEEYARRFEYNKKREELQRRQ